MVSNGRGYQKWWLVKINILGNFTQGYSSLNFGKHMKHHQYSTFHHCILFKCVILSKLEIRNDKVK